MGNVAIKQDGNGMTMENEIEAQVASAAKDSHEVSARLHESSLKMVQAHMTEHYERLQEIDSLRATIADLKDEIARQKVVIDGYHQEIQHVYERMHKMEDDRDAAQRDRADALARLHTIRVMVNEAAEVKT